MYGSIFASQVYLFSNPYWLDGIMQCTWMEFPLHAFLYHYIYNVWYPFHFSSLNFNSVCMNTHISCPWSSSINTTPVCHDDENFVSLLFNIPSDLYSKFQNFNNPLLTQAMSNDMVMDIQNCIIYPIFSAHKTFWFFWKKYSFIIFICRKVLFHSEEASHGWNHILSRLAGG